ncbi:MAG: hypothetical protein OEZ04_10785 [Nitrospinota bacterium]|nr:hypothetical protein [Nitrospinota bacterium]
MIKAAGFLAGAQMDQPAYNSSPITKGAMFTAIKPQAAQAPEELTADELALAESGGCALVEEKTGPPSSGLMVKSKVMTVLKLIAILLVIFIFIFTGPLGYLLIR